MSGGKTLIKKAAADVTEGRLKPPHNGAVFWADHPTRYANGNKDNNTELTRAFCKAVYNGDKANAPRKSLAWMNLAVPLKDIAAHKVPQKTGAVIAELYSRTFAEQASGTVYVAVDRSAFNSYFRMHELRTIMENAAIGKVARLHPQHPATADRPRLKNKWYEAQHLHWLDDACGRLKIARADYAREKNGETAARYKQALTEMAAEILISLQALPQSRAIARKIEGFMQSETDLESIPSGYVEKLGNLLPQPFVQLR